MAFLHAGPGDPHELRPGAQFLDRCAAGVAHGRAQPPGQLLDDGDQAALVRHPALDSLRHQLFELLGRVLLVAVGRTVLLGHGAQRAHAAVGLVGTPLVQLHLARGLLRSGEKTADHGAVRAGGQRLGDVAGIADAAVGDHGNIVLRGRGRNFRHGGDLRDAHAGHDAGGADGPRPDTGFHSVHARLDQRLRAFAADHVAGDQPHVRVVGPQPLDPLDDPAAVAVCGIHHQHIDTGFTQERRPLLGIGARAHRRADPQGAPAVVAGVRKIAGFLEVLGGYQTLQLKVLVHHQHLLDAVLVKQRQDLILVRIFLDCDQAILRRHDLADRTVQTRFEAQVPVGDDARQAAVVLDRQARNIVPPGDFQHLANALVGIDGNRVGNDARCVLLDRRHVAGLEFRRHVLVDDAETPFPRQRDRQRRLRNGVHGRGHHGNIELDTPRGGCRQTHLPGQDLRIGGRQKNIIEGQGFLDDSHRPNQLLYKLSSYKCVAKW